MALALLAGCAPGGAGGGGWPIQSYPYASHPGMLPDAPICLISASINGFRYQDEFQACRVSLQIFQEAMEVHYSSTNSELKKTFDILIEKTNKTYNCYVRYFANEETGDPSVDCPPVDIPQFRGAYVVDGLELYLGVPRCVRKSGEHSLAPKRNYEVSDCKEQVEVFAGKNSYRSSLDATSAQKQYDNYMQNLRRKIDNDVNDAVSKFNCYARNERICI